MRSIADVNVILPLLIGRHPAHAIARSWFDDQPAASVGWSLLIRLGVLRLLCNPRLMASDILSPAAALDAWTTFSSDDRLVEVDQIPNQHEQWLRDFVIRREPTPNLWTDAWLAALARSLECEMVTFDRGFRAFEGLELRLLHIEQT